MNHLLQKGSHEVETDSERIARKYLRKGYVEAGAGVQQEVPKIQKARRPDKLRNTRIRRRVLK